MVLLTPAEIWIQDVWQTRSIALCGLNIEPTTGNELTLIVGPGSDAERLSLRFDSASEADYWYAQVQARQRQLGFEGSDANSRVPEGVSLVKNASDVPYEALGEVEAIGQTRWTAERIIQLRAASRGGDAVINVRLRKCSDAGWAARRVNGLAVRVDDDESRKRLRLKSYAQEVSWLVNRMLLVLIAQAATLFFLGVYGPGKSSLDTPTGETLRESIESNGLSLALLFAWPLALVVILRVLRWPSLLRIVGLTVLTMTSLRALTVWLAHVSAACISGAPLAQSKILYVLLDPFDWFFIIAGVNLAVRAWHVATEAGQILPSDVRLVSTARRTWSRGVMAATAFFAVGFLGYAAIVRYQVSSYMLQPGIDPKREQQALLLSNEGAALADRGNIVAAEQVFRQSLRLWEELAARRAAPPLYRVNLALMLCKMGWICEQRHLDTEAENFFARAVALGDQLAGDPNSDDTFRATMLEARQGLADLQGGKSSKMLEDKEAAGVRKFEEAQVLTGKGEVAAERLFQEAIASWEEILPQATNNEYRKMAIARLAAAHLRLGDLQEQIGRKSPAEENLKKAIEYGERAVSLEPDRPLPKHNLDVARQRLAELREQAFQDKIDNLCGAKRYADASSLFVQNIQEQEEKLRSGKDRDTALFSLAFRHDRYAWFLAHCPDLHVRDTNASVKHARRATELHPGAGGYWNTLAMAQYRNGDWLDSLSSLDAVRAKDGGFDGSGWLLSAMNLQQLNKKGEARDALRKAVEWIAAQRRQAEDNAVLRFQFEMMRPTLEALMREAQSLIEGEGGTGQKVA